MSKEKILEAFNSNLEALIHIEQMMNDLAKDIGKIRRNLEVLRGFV